MADTNSCPPPAPSSHGSSDLPSMLRHLLQIVSHENGVRKPKRSEQVTQALQIIARFWSPSTLPWLD
eukprot:12426835-Karenia_brevis.AAC.1